jgi:lactate dehydrogenase-like 2-hydroxyacid dehydrogenase
LRLNTGIIYCNSGLAAAEAVADFAVALIISTFRHLPWCIGAATLPYLADPNVSDEARGNVFHACHDRATAFSHNPRGHVLGVIGFGNIGQQIATKMRVAFGMKIAYHDVVRKSPALEAEHGATFYNSLAELMRASDCVVLATPASPDGRPLIRTDSLSAMRPGTRFVNIARGSLVDEDALADALEKGVVGAAALDVHATEPRVNPRLIKFAGLEGPQPGRVLLSSHNAGGTVETHIGFEELSMRNIMNVLQGKDAITPVNLHFLNKSKI